MLRDPLEPALLTFAAEIAGRELPTAKVIVPLLELIRHASPVVREGAVYGLSMHDDERVIAELRRIADADPSPGVRTAARDVLEGR
jgi:HEAT repeat protein